MLARYADHSGLEAEIQYCQGLGVSEVRFFEEGGQGKIFFGHHPEYGGVAVKLGKATDGFEAFENECEKYKLISDKANLVGLNLPEIYDVDNGNEHIIMEKIDDGEDLADLFRKGEYSLKERLVLVKQALEQVQLLYNEFGLGHNDIKPANIMQRPDHADHLVDKCYLIDLGSAMTGDELTEAVEQYGLENISSKRYLHPVRESIFEICEDAGEDAIPYLQGYSAAVLIVDAVLGEHGYSDGCPLEYETLRSVLKQLKATYSDLSSFLGDLFGEVETNQGYPLEEVIDELTSALSK